MEAVMIWKHFALAAVAIALPAPQPARAVTFTPLDFPGSNHTEAWGVSGSNVVGLFEDATGNSYAFLFNGTSYSEIQFPGSEGGAAYGVDGENIVGTYFGTTEHSFVFNGSNYQTIDYPEATLTNAFGIDGRNIVGQYFDKAGTSHGFLYDGTSWATIDYPHLVPFTYAIPYGIFSGKIGIDVSAGFSALYQNGTFSQFRVPGALSSSIHGLDGATIVGDYTDDPLQVEHGFVFDGSNFTSIDYPGSIATVIFGVDGDQVVGAYTDSARLTHGFVATLPEPPTLVAALVGAALAAGVQPISSRGRRSIMPPKV
jgi:hypothetical protein